MHSDDDLALFAQWHEQGKATEKIRQKPKEFWDDLLESKLSAWTKDREIGMRLGLLSVSCELISVQTTEISEKMAR